VIGRGLMVESPAPGLVVRITPYTNRGAIGFTRPWAHAGVKLASSNA